MGPPTRRRLLLPKPPPPPLPSLPPLATMSLPPRACRMRPLLKLGCTPALPCPSETSIPSPAVSAVSQKSDRCHTTAISPSHLHKPMQYVKISGKNHTVTLTKLSQSLPINATATLCCVQRTNLKPARVKHRLPADGPLQPVIPIIVIDKGKKKPKPLETSKIATSYTRFKERLERRKSVQPSAKQNSVETPLDLQGSSIELAQPDVLCNVDRSAGGSVLKDKQNADSDMAVSKSKWSAFSNDSAPSVLPLQFNPVDNNYVDHSNPTYSVDSDQNPCAGLTSEVGSGTSSTSNEVFSIRDNSVDSGAESEARKRSVSPDIVVLEENITRVTPAEKQRMECNRKETTVSSGVSYPDEEVTCLDHIESRVEASQMPEVRGVVKNPKEHSDTSHNIVTDSEQCTENADDSSSSLQIANVCTVPTMTGRLEVEEDDSDVDILFGSDSVIPNMTETCKQQQEADFSMATNEEELPEAANDGVSCLKITNVCSIRPVSIPDESEDEEVEILSLGSETLVSDIGDTETVPVEPKSNSNSSAASLKEMSPEYLCQEHFSAVNASDDSTTVPVSRFSVANSLPGHVEVTFIPADQHRNISLRETGDDVPLTPAFSSSSSSVDEVDVETEAEVSLASEVIWLQSSCQETASDVVFEHRTGAEIIPERGPESDRVTTNTAGHVNGTSSAQEDSDISVIEPDWRTAVPPQSMTECEETFPSRTAAQSFPAKQRSGLEDSNIRILERDHHTAYLPRSNIDWDADALSRLAQQTLTANQATNARGSDVTISEHLASIGNQSMSVSGSDRETHIPTDSAKRRCENRTVATNPEGSVAADATQPSIALQRRQRRENQTVATNPEGSVSIIADDATLASDASQHRRRSARHLSASQCRNPTCGGCESVSPTKQRSPKKRRASQQGDGLTKKRRANQKEAAESRVEEQELQEPAAVSADAESMYKVARLLQQDLDELQREKDDKELVAQELASARDALSNETRRLTHFQSQQASDRKDLADLRHMLQERKKDFYASRLAEEVRLGLVERDGPRLDLDTSALPSFASVWLDLQSKG